MGRYSGSFKSTGAGSATLPLGSFYAAASVAPKLRLVEVFNTTTTALEVALYRLTTTGTQGAEITTETKMDPDSPSATASAWNTHSVAPTLGTEIKRASIGAAIGAGIIWPFDAEPIRIPPGTANGVGIIIPAGTGQVCIVSFEWEE
jgi:hypothetical protein